MSNKKISTIQILVLQAVFVFAYVAAFVLITLVLYGGFLFTAYAIEGLLTYLRLPIDTEMVSKAVPLVFISYYIGKGSKKLKKQFSDYWQAIVDIKTINGGAKPMANKYLNRFDLLIYFVISFLINFTYFIFECDLKIGELKGWQLVGGTFLWVIGMCLSRVSYLYSSNKNDNST